MESRRVLIMAGGTGGHVFPGLAVAEVLRQRGIEVSWLGTQRGVEAELVPARGFPIFYVDVAGLRGKQGLTGKLMAPWRLLRALWQALGVLRTARPNVVLGLGGFVAGPGGLAARLLTVPLVIHEQNAVAGTTNRILNRIANRALEAFPGSLAGAEYCGNPIRARISEIPAPELRFAQRRAGPARLLVLGGSLGALAINHLLPASLALMRDEERPDVLHQTGRDHLEVTRAAYAAAGVTADTRAFIDDMAEAYAWADLVLCRAGALTVSELTAAGLGAVLIPYPHAIDDHQTVNGQWLVEHQAAVLLQQSALTASTLREVLGDLFEDRSRLRAMALAAYTLRQPRAAQRVADVCQELAA